MESAFLFIANNVAADALDEFNSWYQEEHLPERLGVAGFIEARRYEALKGTPRYLAVYAIESPTVLQSSAYLQCLAQPSVRTRAIMPHFQDMSRSVMSPAYHRARGLGGVLGVLFLEPPPPEERDVFAQLAGGIERALAGDAAMEGLTILRAAQQRTSAATNESRLRGAPDHVARAIVMLQWAKRECAVIEDVANLALAQGWRVDHDRGGIYSLLCMRSAPAAG